MQKLHSLTILIAISLLTNTVCFAQQTIQGESFFTQSGQSTYIDYTITDHDIASGLDKIFFYGDDAAFSNSQWFYFYQIESLVSGEGVYNFQIYDFDTSSISSYGYFTAADMEAMPFDHNLLSSGNESFEGNDSNDYIPSNMARNTLYDRFYVGYGTLTSFPESDPPQFPVQNTDPIPYYKESAILFITSSNAPDEHSAILKGMAYGGEGVLLNGEILAPAASVPEPSAMLLFLFGLFYMGKKVKKSLS